MSPEQLDILHTMREEFEETSADEKLTVSIQRAERGPATALTFGKTCPEYFSASLTYIFGKAMPEAYLDGCSSVASV